MHIRFPAIAAALLLSACQPAPAATGKASSSEFMARLAAYCGAAYQGIVVSDDAEDEAWRSETIIADFASCTEDEVRIPLHVGDDHSRTWIITRGEEGRLSLHHQHNHEDGRPDALSMYGGMASGTSSGSRQVFPADDQTKDLFDREGIPVSKDNIWAMEIRPDANLLAYELERPGRFFRLEFDLSDPVEAPGDPW